MRVTQQDIARIANVSQATVSRVLSGDVKVEPSIRERVQATMRELNYRPDVRARSLRTKRTGLVGLVVKRASEDLSDDPFFARLISEIVEYLSGRPYHLCVDVASDESTAEAVYDEMLRTRRVDGLILVEPEARDERVERLQADRFPFVLIGNPLAGDHVWSVDNDNVFAGEIASAHLLDAGYRRVGFLGARMGVTVSDDRIAGYQRALRGRQEDHLVWHADFGLEAAKTAGLEILSSAERPDALVVLDDFMAMGVVLASRELGLGIPGDLGIASFNDTSLCQLLEGGLTSVSLNIGQIVRQACDELLRIIEDRTSVQPSRFVVPCELKVRGSSARPLEALT
jgi:DNA-binding LacI/PurR family transcriptional regulator